MNYCFQNLGISKLPRMSAFTCKLYEVLFAGGKPFDVQFLVVGT